MDDDTPGADGLISLRGMVVSRAGIGTAPQPGDGSSRLIPLHSISPCFAHSIPNIGPAGLQHAIRPPSAWQACIFALRKDRRDHPVRPPAGMVPRDTGIRIDALTAHHIGYATWHPPCSPLFRGFRPGSGNRGERKEVMAPDEVTAETGKV